MRVEVRIDSNGLFTETLKGGGQGHGASPIVVALVVPTLFRRGCQSVSYSLGLPCSGWKGPGTPLRGPGPAPPLVRQPESFCECLPIEPEGDHLDDTRILGGSRAIERLPWAVGPVACGSVLEASRGVQGDQHNKIETFT